MLPLLCCQIHIFYHTNICRYSDVIMGASASQFTSLAIVYSTVYSGVDQRKRQSSASLVFVRKIHRWPVNPSHKWSVTRKMFPFGDVITAILAISSLHFPIFVNSKWYSTCLIHKHMNIVNALDDQSRLWGTSIICKNPNIFTVHGHIIKGH